ncbi:MAG: peptidase S41, partial [Chitinophagaceae bacterium]|nr:peptidase S41 [Chitinophagaceae bacterium]
DTLVVIGNLNRKDSALTRGTIITSINNRTSPYLIDTFLHYITGDGNSITGKYQSLSSYGTFGVMYKNLYGLPDSFRVHFINLYGLDDSTIIPVFKPVKETENKSDSLKPEKYSSRERRNMFTYSSRSLQVDTTLRSGYLVLNTFVSGNGLRHFIKTSFKKLEKLKIKYLAIDVRSNGGGDAGISTLLTRFISDHSFKLADSLYAVKRSSRYHRYIHLQPAYWVMTTIVTRKHPDGKFHFGYFERHKFRPKKKHHFDGNVYVLTGGNSFSATTLFAQELKGQNNVKIIGEETGGGGYGNTAWIIPELTLPNTRIRISIPKLRFVMRPDLVKEAKGVIPDVYVAPTSEDIRNGADVKVEAVKRLIMKANGY